MAGPLEDHAVDRGPDLEPGAVGFPDADRIRSDSRRQELVEERAHEHDAHADLEAGPESERPQNQHPTQRCNEDVSPQQNNDDCGCQHRQPCGLPQRVGQADIAQQIDDERDRDDRLRERDHSAPLDRH